MPIAALNLFRKTVELIQKNVGYFFKDIERSGLTLTLKDSLYLLKNTEEIQRAVITEEIQRAVILKMEMMPFLDSENGNDAIFRLGGTGT